MEEEQLILPTLYFPPISVLACVAKAQNVMVESCENYQKKSYRNKATILSTDGVLKLSVPLVKGKSSQTNIKEVKISYTQNWVRLHLETLKSCYGSSAFFLYYIDNVSTILQKKPDFLFDLNLQLFQWILDSIPLEKTIKHTENYQPTYPNDVLDLRKTQEPLDEQIHYPQVFEDRFGFVPDLSILDLLFCMGPESINYLK